MTVLALGLDACKGGWVAVAIEDGRFASCAVFRRIAAALEAHEAAHAVGIDMPIGLPEAPPRAADVAASAFLRGRPGVVFPTYPREVYEQSSHPEAARLCKARGWPGISRQSWNLKERILEVERARDDRAFELHAEGSFRALAGRPIGFSKHSWSGFMVRRRVLASAGIELPDDLGTAPLVDVLDAAAAAWSADRHARGDSRSLPEGARAATGVIRY